MRTQSFASRRSTTTPWAAAEFLLEIEHAADELAEMDDLPNGSARPRQLQELGEQPIEAPDLVPNDLRLVTKHGARLGVDAEFCPDGGPKGEAARRRR